jgi:hypothetical protein
MDALKILFDMVCFGCFIVVSVLVILMMAGMLVTSLVWAFQENPRTFVAGIGVVTVLACALRGLMKMDWNS